MKQKLRRIRPFWTRVYMMVVLLSLITSNAYAVTPEAPPGGLNFQAGADKLMGHMLWLVPVVVGALATYMWYSGMWGVEDRSKRAETRENIQKLVKYAIYVWIGAAVIKGVFIAIGISNGT